MFGITRVLKMRVQSDPAGLDEPVDAHSKIRRRR
jgi:hypothetical protein